MSNYPETYLNEPEQIDGLIDGLQVKVDIDKHVINEKTLYLCNLCGREYKLKASLVKHLGKRQSCINRRDIRNLNNLLEKEKISLNEYLNEFENDMDAINDFIVSFNNKTLSISDINKLRYELGKVSSKLKTIRLTVRTYYTTKTKKEIENYEQEMEKYTQQIIALKNKYKLLFI